MSAAFSTNFQRGDSHHIIVTTTPAVEWLVGAKACCCCCRRHPQFVAPTQVIQSVIFYCNNHLCRCADAVNPDGARAVSGIEATARAAKKERSLYPKNRVAHDSPTGASPGFTVSSFGLRPSCCFQRVGCFGMWRILRCHNSTNFTPSRRGI